MPELSAILKPLSLLDDGSFLVLMVAILIGYRFVTRQVQLPAGTRKWILTGLLLLFLSSLVDFSDEFLFPKNHHASLAEAVADFIEDSIGRTLGLGCLTWGIYLVLRRRP